MIIVEGPDRIGKTTLCHKLASLGSMKVAKMNRPDEDFRFPYDYQDAIQENVIFDRFHLGGYVYHDNVMSRRDQRWIEGKLMMEGAITVLLLPDLAWYNRWIRQIGDEMWDVEQLLHFATKWWAISKYIHYDYKIIVDEHEWSKWHEHAVNIGRGYNNIVKKEHSCFQFPE